MDIKIRLNNYQPSSSTLAKIAIGVVLAAFLGFLIGPLGLGREFALGGLKAAIVIGISAFLIPIPFKLMKQADGTPAKKLKELFKLTDVVQEAENSRQDRANYPKFRPKSRAHKHQMYQPGKK